MWRLGEGVGPGHGRRMSKARLVITAVITEGRSPAEVATAYGVSRSWVYQLVARYRAQGQAAFEPRSRRPRTCPRAIGDATVRLITELRKELAGQGLDAGPDTIAWHLEHHHHIRVSPATISRYLARAGLVAPEPSKRPRSSYIRFAAEQPNECWQADFTHYPLAGGTGTEILSWLDDHSRYALPVTAWHRVSGPAVLATFRAAVSAYGPPAATLTDNGMVFTTRLSGGQGGRNGFEHELRRLGITQKNGKPNHPQTQGKVERFQQTLKNWLAAQHPQPADLPSRDQRRDGGADRRVAQGTGRAGPGRRAGHHRLALGTPPWHRGVSGDHQPLPGPGRPGGPAAAQAAEIVLPAV